MTVLTSKPYQIYLRQSQLEALRTLAQRRDVSVAELVRQGVDMLLANLPVEEDPLLDIIGMFNSGVGDLSTNHDQYLAKFEIENTMEWQKKSS